MSTEQDDLELGDIFPEEPRPPSPEPTFASYIREPRALHDVGDWTEISIKLVGSHPLWGHYLWNAARAFASYLDAHPNLYRGRSVLELGAGGGLPSIVTAVNGAHLVVSTDYPDESLIRNLEDNVARNVPCSFRDATTVQGYIWGQSVKPLMDMLQKRRPQTLGYDLVILSDLIFNHSQHEALLRTCEDTISRTPTPDPDGGEPLIPCVLVFFTHHRPHLAHRDMAFFTLAQERSWLCEKIVTQTLPPMFPDDPGEEIVRSTVHGWKLTRPTH